MLNVWETWFLYLVIYSFIGWAYESTVCSVAERKLVNRGFLNGPVCPIYGVGAVAVIALLNPLKDNSLALFFSSATLTTTLEYVTSWLMETLLHLSLIHISPLLIGLPLRLFRALRAAKLRPHWAYYALFRPQGARFVRPPRLQPLCGLRLRTVLRSVCSGLQPLRGLRRSQARLRHSLFHWSLRTGLRFAGPVFRGFGALRAVLAPPPLRGFDGCGLFRALRAAFVRPLCTREALG